MIVVEQGGVIDQLPAPNRRSRSQSRAAGQQVAIEMQLVGDVSYSGETGRRIA